MSVPYDPEHITYFAETDFRSQRTRFGIKSRDRTRHMYVIGKSGVGKSTLLENMAIQDIEHGEGIAVLDPHGSFAEKMLDYVPSHRIKDVIYFAPFDTDNPISFNILEDVGADKRHFVASGLMSTFKKIWVDAWSARMEYILNNILLALLEYPDATILGVNRMLSDKEFRKKVVENVTDPGVKTFWTDEFAKYGERYMQEAGAAIQNKIGQFIANPLVRNIIGQSRSSFDIRKVMDEQKILIINLSKGRIGEQNTSLLGSMLITKIYLAAMSRAEETHTRQAQLPGFYFYVDEFQSFANETFADILAEARKYKLALIIAHQYVAQMEEAVRDAVFGNVGTTISFRVGPLDAELLEKVFSPQFTANDLVNLGMAQIYLSLMINDIGSPAFSARTLPPVPRPTISYKSDCIEWSREAYAVPRDQVQTQITEWYAQGADDPKSGFEGRGDYRPQYNKKQFTPNERNEIRSEQPFKKAFAKQEIPVDVPFEDEPMPTPAERSGSFARVKMPRKESASRMHPQKPFIRQFSKSAPDEEIQSPGVNALLSSLNFEKKPIQEAMKAPIPEEKPESVVTPFPEEKPLERAIKEPIKTFDRAASDTQKNLLRDALAKITSPKQQEGSLQEKQEPASQKPPEKQIDKKTPLPDSSHPKEVSHEEIKKILE